ncbi:hypothetical protein CR513_15053, partial [Mucuna pruriens]
MNFHYEFLDFDDFKDCDYTCTELTKCPICVEIGNVTNVGAGVIDISEVVDVTSIAIHGATITSLNTHYKPKVENHDHPNLSDFLNFARSAKAQIDIKLHLLHPKIVRPKPTGSNPSDGAETTKESSRDPVKSSSAETTKESPPTQSNLRLKPEDETESTPSVA